ncbi:hypothetical protein IGI04_028935 [Brassica rapa subsp. trilocularis]|nr:hypothetical protein IGI04_028935 [Brassica rapa subsp. trilocularis]CAG7904752.1 unnamed protein product [Brassica rapa]VDD02240.1 unnamed protein product [Brassica rapa]
MSSPQSSTSSSSPPSSLPNGVTAGANNPNREEPTVTSTQQPNSDATTGANNPNREEPAVTSTRQPNPVAVPSPHRCHDPNAEVVALRPRTFLAAGICELCGKEFTQEQIRDFNR